MELRTWRNDAALDPEFERAWHGRIARTPGAHFAFDPAWLLDRSRRGEIAIAILADEDGLGGVLVLREHDRELRCGWPWRLHALVEPASADGPPAAPGAGDSAWLFRAAELAAGRRRLRAYLPGRPERGPSLAAGAVVLRPLGSHAGTGDDRDAGSPRAMRKLERSGYRIGPATSLEDLRGFATLRGELPPSLFPPETPEAGSSWREWELPWMRLLVAVHEGAVVAGHGIALLPGGVASHQASAATERARADRVDRALAREAERLARAAGCRAIEPGAHAGPGPDGATLELRCWLGGKGWGLANRIEALVARGREREGAARKRRRPLAEEPAETTVELGENLSGEDVIAGAAGAAPEPATAASETATAAPPAPSARPPRKPRRPPTGVHAAWSTRDPVDPEFVEAWNATLARCSRAHFALNLAHLEVEAELGLHSRAAILERDGRRGLFVLRARHGQWICGWPWRWQATVEDGAGAEPLELDPDEADWLWNGMRALAGGGRLRAYLPASPPSSIAGFEAGATLMQSLDHADDELLELMSAEARARTRAACEAGWRVSVASGPDEWRRFVELQRDSETRRGLDPAPVPDAPGRGESWREWELPWMWLLVAAREDGRIEAGLGDGVHPGGVLEARAGAASREAMRDGALPLLCWEELRRARDHGHRRLNHGGDTPFKRAIAGRAGRRVALHCWLGGGATWGLANESEAWARRLRPQVTEWARSLTTRRGATT